MYVTGFDFFNEPILLFISSSLLLTALDVVLDPIAVDEGRWKWENQVLSIMFQYIIFWMVLYNIYCSIMF